MHLRGFEGDIAAHLAVHVDPGCAHRQLYERSHSDSRQVEPTQKRHSMACLVHPCTCTSDISKECVPCRSVTQTGEMLGTWVLAVARQIAAIAAAMEQTQHLHGGAFPASTRAISTRSIGSTSRTV